HLLLAAAERARLLVAAPLHPREVLEDARRLPADGAPLTAHVRAHAQVLPDAERTCAWARTCAVSGAPSAGRRRASSSTSRGWSGAATSRRARSAAASSR